ncbi:class I SAM-dependent methyltransferase [Corynebacterium uberis]|uniref:class I SAM-dependent methyltransferase n=1 Tax=Corynebacterium TaxID=1716 RepID=UPI001D0B8FA7|nr:MULTISPECIES: class I SAM-dependent methyltransferase [Corynebacterium]MCZ9309544.1 class I SAM-dependent methyltransferase [Corynebacterium sp. c6VSa_13]UDL73089.1 class I SAM-dependent methyltransferase [Corynebacterium uberis]UDL76034.1 class I SAM-dependent methyltransferase [Corynebacterium uberis]UDL78246.1 class I SAM-dependent methyltransferase [Corynebacterium uberis]UDL80529.1 class I SAM-dependent methyltransferase [Corynebacterium uberis]
MADHAHNLRARFDDTTDAPVGVITRGTTGYNRLRRADRWMAHHPAIRDVLRRAEHPLAVDVGYGASHTTTVEWARWLRGVRPDVAVTGLEIDPDRVLPPRDGVTFALGGFELAGLRPQVVRAFNVLRQYDVAQVHAAWHTVTSRLAAGGFFIEGTCDELGRRATWILLDAHGPRSLTLAWDPFDVERPSDLAERLPKALIHNNRPGQPIHEFLTLLDAAWDRAAGWSPYGPRVRWRHAHEDLRAAGVPIDPQRRRLRDNTITVAWSLVAP